MSSALYNIALHNIVHCSSKQCVNCVQYQWQCALYSQSCKIQFFAHSLHEFVYMQWKAEHILHRGPLCQSISRLKNLLNWCWKPAKTSFLSVSKLIKWMWWVVKYKSERPRKTEIEGGGFQIWHHPELTLRGFGPKGRFWKTLEYLLKYLKDPEQLCWWVHCLSMRHVRLWPDALSHRGGLFQKCCHRRHWRLMSWLANPSLGGGTTRLIGWRNHPPSHQTLILFHFLELCCVQLRITMSSCYSWSWWDYLRWPPPHLTLSSPVSGEHTVRRCRLASSTMNDVALLKQCSDNRCYWKGGKGGPYSNTICF